MKLFFFWLFFVLISQSNAIFEEQLGEYDWRKENIGLVEKSIQIEGKLLVYTSENILACISSESGVPLWRMYLSPFTTVDKFLVVDQIVLTLTRQVNVKNVDVVLVRGWSLFDGSLRWESSVGVPAVRVVGSLSDLVFDRINNMLTVLSDNSLHFISLQRKNDAVISSWSWSPSESNSSVELSGLVISSLVVPTKLSSAQSNELRIAVGCTVLSISWCEKAVVLRVDLKASKIYFDVFSGVSQLSLENLRASVSSDAATTYTEDDVIFSSVRPLNNGEFLTLTVLSLVSGEIVNISSDHSVPQQSVATIGTFVYATTDNEIRPAVQYCWSHISASECEAGIAVRLAGVWEWQTIVSGARREGGESLSSISLEPLSYYADLVFGTHCVSAVWESNSSFSVLKTLVVDSYSRSRLTVPLNIQHPAPSQMSGIHLTSFRHVSVQKRPSSYDKTVDEFFVLLVLHSGLTLFVQASSSAHRVVWIRDEGLARMQQVALVDVDRHHSELSAGEGSNDIDIPGLVERYALQAEELKVILLFDFLSMLSFNFFSGFRFFWGVLLIFDLSRGLRC
jgi:hypothetical protein